MIGKSWLRNGWSAWHLVACALLSAIGAVATLDAWVDICRIAVKDEESSHIFLVPVVMGWLIWVRRRRFRKCRPEGTWIGPLLVALGWFCYSFGDARLVQSLWHGGAVLVVLGCFASVAGRGVLVEFLPAFAAMIFLVPVPGRLRQHIAIPLGSATAHVTQRLFEVIGLAVERSGNVLSINGIQVAIAEACNGLRMVFALVLVSYAFSFGMPLRSYARVLVLAASPISAIACNVIRLVPTVWVYGHLSHMTADQFHDVGGWVMLGVAFLMLTGILRVLRWALVPVTRYTLAYE